MRWLCLWGVLLLLNGVAQELNLREDSRLDAPITLSEPLISLNDLLKQLSRSTGVPLTVAPDVADDKVCVIVWNQPAHETLMRLAETLRYRWAHTTDGKGYRLFQSPAERQRERELARLIPQRIQQRLTDRVRALVRRASSMNFQRWMSREAETISELHGNFLEAYWSLRVMSLLPEAAWNRLWQGEVVDLSTRPSRNAIPIPETLAEQLRVAFASNEEQDADFRRVEYVSVVISYDLGAGDLNISFYGSYHGAYRSRSASFLMLMGDWDGLAASLDQHPLQREWREWATGELEAEVAFPNADGALQSLLRRTLDEPLQPIVALAWTRRLNLIADAYRLRSRDRWETFDSDTPAPKPIVPYLDENLLKRFLWLRREGTWLLVRHKDYPLLRPSEVPERLLRPLEQAQVERKPLSLDDWAQLAMALTPLHKERMYGRQRLGYGTAQPVVLNTSLPVGMLLATLPALRFWASLSPAQRQATLNGAAIELRTLTPLQRARFVEALRFPGEPRVSGVVYNISTIGDIAIELPEYVRDSITPATLRKLEEAPLDTARFTIQMVSLSMRNYLRHEDLALGIAEEERSSLLERLQRELAGEAWRLRFAVDDAERDYYVYRTLPPALGKQVKMR